MRENLLMSARAGLDGRREWTFDRGDQRIQRLLGIAKAGEVRGEAPLALLDQPAYVGAGHRQACGLSLIHI